MSSKPKSNPMDPAKRRLTVAIGTLAIAPLLSAAPGAAWAQPAKYPTNNVRILVGYSPGGTADVMARLIAENLQTALGENVIVENRPGASGNIAAQQVSRATADGHTLLFGNTAEMAINKYLMTDMGFDPDTDLTPVALIFSITHAITVPVKSPYKTLMDLVEDARRTPGKVRFASAGTGTPGHLAGEALARKTKTSMVHVPYKGGSQALTDVIGGHVDCYYAGLTAAMPHVRAGTIRILAVTSLKRVSAAPEIPTVVEQGVPDFDFPLWGGLFAPARTSPDVIGALNREVNKAFDRPNVRAQIAAQFSEIAQLSPDQFGAFVKSQSAKYRDIIKEIGLGSR